MPVRFKPSSCILQVRKSNIGRGLFTVDTIAKGVCVVEYIGKPATEKQMLEDKGKYLFRNGKGKMIDGYVPGNIARFINHSCRPNCEIDIYRGRVFIFAKRRIREGEELTYDYGEEYFEAHIRPLGCKCIKCQK